MATRNKGRRSRPLSPRRTFSLLRSALTPEVKPPGLDIEALAGGHESLIRGLPAWVKRFGFLARTGQYCLWCEPRAAPRQTFASQMILDLPRGRYLYD